MVALAACGVDAPGPPDDDVPPVTLAARPPPPISGGTLAFADDLGWLVASDPDRDRVYGVDPAGRSMVMDLDLEQGAEPGRVAVGAGRAFVVLRGAAEVATIDLAGQAILERRAVCAVPRGVVYDADFEADGTTIPVLHVACMSGELVTVPVSGSGVIRSIVLGEDLRDVVIDGDGLIVTRFRAPSVFVVSKQGEVMEQISLPALTGEFEFEPTVAWRAAGLPDGGVAVVHQRGKLSEIRVEPGAYTVGECSDEVVHSTITIVRPDQQKARTVSLPYLPSAVLPVDVAVSADGQTFAAVSAGTNQIIRVRQDAFRAASRCGTTVYDDTSIVLQDVAGQPIAVSFLPDNRLAVQTREPASLFILPALKASGVQQSYAGVPLSPLSALDTGHEMFHRPPSGQGLVTCAGCHTEGGDDGRTWTFGPPFGKRRTQNLRGHILDTAPFHWDGTLADFRELLHDTLEVRMNGSVDGPEHVDAFARWIDSITPLPRLSPRPADAVERGRAAFVKGGCDSCHLGPKYTNNETRDVGTGLPVQVPSLVGIWARGPFMHTGCASTLRDRFDPACGGGDLHGVTSTLSAGEVDDMITFLESL